MLIGNNNNDDDAEASSSIVLNVVKGTIVTFTTKTDERVIRKVSPLIITLIITNR